MLYNRKRILNLILYTLRLCYPATEYLVIPVILPTFLSEYWDPREGQITNLAKIELRCVCEVSLSRGRITCPECIPLVNLPTIFSDEIPTSLVKFDIKSTSARFHGHLHKISKARLFSKVFSKCLHL